jgi:hypothetical protein
VPNNQQQTAEVGWVTTQQHFVSDATAEAMHVWKIGSKTVRAALSSMAQLSTVSFTRMNTSLDPFSSRQPKEDSLDKVAGNFEIKQSLASRLTLRLRQ